MDLNKMIALIGRSIKVWFVVLTWSSVAEAQQRDRQASTPAPSAEI